MRRPPECVVFVARTHWIVAAAIAGCTLPVHWLGQRLPGFETGSNMWMIAGGLALAYGLTGTLVWLGAPPGRLLSRMCSLVYLPRPQFGSRVWEAMNRTDFQAHFRRT